MCMVWPCNSFVEGLSYKCINVHKIKKVKIINHDCLPILMLLYIMLLYLMLFAALFNALCSFNAYALYFIANDVCKCFFFSCFVFELLTQFV